MKDETIKLLSDLFFYAVVGFITFTLGMAMSNKNVQNDCNQFITDEILSHEVRRCLGDFSALDTSEYDFINISFLIDAPVKSGNKTIGGLT